jgi:hypothetical protein
MLEEKVQELTDLIEGLWWTSEADYPWILEVLPEFNLDSAFEIVDFDQFFAIATQIKSWHGEREKLEVKRYQDLVTWLQENLTDLTVYRHGEIEVTIWVVGKIDSHWFVLKTTAVET